LIDAHCHLDSARLGTSGEVAVAEAREVGVDGIVMAGVDPSGWEAQQALAKRCTGVFPVFGIHPQLVPELDGPALDAMLGELHLALGQDRPVALGETGLDRLTAANKAAILLQEHAFRAQLRLARRHDLPVVLHLLKADALALQILAEEALPERGGMVHGFSGSAEFAKKLVGFGLHVSFAGTLTFPQSRRLREAAAAVPIDRLLVETDAPDQTPVPHRGEPNRPALLPLVVQALAQVRALPFEEVAAFTAANAKRLFQLPFS